MAFEFAKTNKRDKVVLNEEKWNILIVDDDIEVHELTKMVFKKFIFKDKRVHFYHALSTKEAETILKEKKEIALVLLDVVMEEEDSGLKIVRFIREQLNNDAIRIILRTGQPGIAPEERILRDYDINDYKSKTELSEMHLITIVISSLRSYENIIRIKQEVYKNLLQEKQLTQQARSSAMGEMMAAIIHQWKQPLGTINSIAANLKVQVALETINLKMVDSEMEKINNIISHMVNTMNDFRDFFKPSQKERYSIKTAIESAISLVGKTYEAQGIRIKQNIDEKLVTQGYENEFIQVILNILSNARDQIEQYEPKIKEIEIDAYEENEKIIITISDYAGGIEEEILETIFQQYFTTKGIEKGVGIGLDMSRTIIKKVGGTLYAQNFEKDGERGACFVIELNKI